MFNNTDSEIPDSDVPDSPIQPKRRRIIGKFLKITIIIMALNKTKY